MGTSEAIRVEGTLLGPDQIERIGRREALVQNATDYGVPRGLTLRQEIERAYRVARDCYVGATPTSLTMLELLRDVFGWSDLERVGHVETGEGRYPIPLATNDLRVPVATADGGDDPLGRLDRAVRESGEDGRYRSPALLLQDVLNADERSLWGVVGDARRVRLMRDSVRLGRPAYVEIDLGSIVEADDLGTFSTAWLLLHRSRFPDGDELPAQCPLERWAEEGRDRGTKARERLRDGVERALVALGTGALQDPQVRDAVLDGRLPVRALFAELLQLVYRMILVLTAEDRGLLHAPDASETAKAHYAEGYALSRQVRLARHRRAHDTNRDHHEAARIVFRALAEGESALGLPALGGLFRSDATPTLDGTSLRNEAWMGALFHLGWIADPGSGALSRVNWRDLRTEELGSIYESLLELEPRLADGGTRLSFAGVGESRGNERKTSGSYYTPDSLVQALLDLALDPVIEARRREAGVEGLLRLTVADPACGSGHMLLAAGRRIAQAVARERARTEGGEGYTVDAYREALREVVQRCLFGVDRNELAVELARVALWIESIVPGRPLSFLDGNVRWGDSLLGVLDLGSLADGIPDDAYKALTGDDDLVAKGLKRRNASERSGQGELGLSEGDALTLPSALGATTGALLMDEQATLDAVERTRDRYLAMRADDTRRRLQLACDMTVVAYLAPKRVGDADGTTVSHVPTTADLHRVRGGESVAPALEAFVHETAKAARLFHWPLEFPSVMDAGGFDVMLGNPPWEQIKLKEKEFFASRDADIASASNAAVRGRLIAKLARSNEPTEREIYAEFVAAKRLAEATSDLVRTNGRYPLTGRGHVNLYALFAELFSQSAGAAGFIVPTGIATDKTTSEFFAHLIEERRLAELIDFENREGLFPGVHRSYKFCLLTLARSADIARFAFFLTNTAQLADEDRQFTLSVDQIAAINPNTRTVPVFRSKRDAELTAKIYANVPVMIDKSQGDAGNAWGMSFKQGLFNMSSDSGLFRTTEYLLGGEYSLRGTAQGDANALRSAVEDSALTDSSARDREVIVDGTAWLPLYEAKMIHHYDHRWAGYLPDGSVADTTEAQHADPGYEPMPRYWVERAEVDQKLTSKG